MLREYEYRLLRWRWNHQHLSQLRLLWLMKRMCPIGAAGKPQRGDLRGLDLPQLPCLASTRSPTLPRPAPAPRAQNAAHTMNTAHGTPTFARTNTNATC
jgi:hypothetical protein